MILNLFAWNSPEAFESLKLLISVFLRTGSVVAKSLPTPKCEECAPVRLWNQSGEQTQKSYAESLFECESTRLQAGDLLQQACEARRRDRPPSKGSPDKGAVTAAGTPGRDIRRRTAASETIPTGRRCRARRDIQRNQAGAHSAC